MPLAWAGWVSLRLPILHVSILFESLLVAWPVAVIDATLQLKTLLPQRGSMIHANIGEDGMTQQLGIAVMGRAAIAKYSMIPAILAEPAWKLVAVESRDRSKAQDFAVQFGCRLAPRDLATRLPITALLGTGPRA